MRQETVADPRAELADLLRGRILRAMYAGSLKAGDRLPSARDLSTEFGTDHRVILDAYRTLAREGLVELRQRGGIYVASTGSRVPMPSDHWLSELFAQGVAREIPVTDLHEWLHRAVSTLRLRAVAVERSDDQVSGLCRELVSDYGLEATGLDVAVLEAGEDVQELRYADVIITTQSLGDRVRPHAERLGKPVIVVAVRLDLIPGEWRLLLRRPVYVLVGDERFIPVFMKRFADTPGVDNLHMLIVGRDDLSIIPDGAPVYVTASARRMLSDVQIRGNVLPSVRLFSSESSLEIIRFIVAANLDAIGSRTPQRRLQR
jgi:DNA-binding transcriptional regulator YhcF (GntR family)